MQVNVRPLRIDCCHFLEQIVLEEEVLVTKTAKICFARCFQRTEFQQVWLSALLRPRLFHCVDVKNLGSLFQRITTRVAVGSLFSLHACLLKNSFSAQKCIFNPENRGDENMVSRKNARQRRVENRLGRKTRPFGGLVKTFPGCPCFQVSSHPFHGPS